MKFKKAKVKSSFFHLRAIARVFFFLVNNEILQGLCTALCKRLTMNQFTLFPMVLPSCKYPTFSHTD